MENAAAAAAACILNPIIGKVIIFNKQQLESMMI
jgi:hypothetical protein